MSNIKWKMIYEKSTPLPLSTLPRLRSHSRLKSLALCDCATSERWYVRPPALSRTYALAPAIRIGAPRQVFARGRRAFLLRRHSLIAPRDPSALSPADLKAILFRRGDFAPTRHRDRVIP